MSRRRHILNTLNSTTGPQSWVFDGQTWVDRRHDVRFDDTSPTDSIKLGIYIPLCVAKFWCEVIWELAAKCQHAALAWSDTCSPCRQHVQISRVYRVSWNNASQPLFLCVWMSMGLFLYLQFLALCVCVSQLMCIHQRSCERTASQTPPPLSLLLSWTSLPDLSRVCRCVLDVTSWRRDTNHLTFSHLFSQIPPLPACDLWQECIALQRNSWCRISSKQLVSIVK